MLKCDTQYYPWGIAKISNPTVDLPTTYQELPGTDEQVHHHHKDADNKIQTTGDSINQTVNSA